jgi:hypothetical protein
MGAKRALLVGINYIGTENALNGCINDVENMCDVLKSEFGYNENDILCDNEISKSEIPQFWYEYDGSKHRYYPDICILSERKIIEVKSNYTASYKPEIIQLKRDSVIQAGFNIELWVFDDKKELTIC